MDRPCQVHASYYLDLAAAAGMELTTCPSRWASSAHSEASAWPCTLSPAGLASPTGIAAHFGDWCTQSPESMSTIPKTSACPSRGHHNQVLSWKQRKQRATAGRQQAVSASALGMQPQDGGKEDSVLHKSPSPGARREPWKTQCSWSGSRSQAPGPRSWRGRKSLQAASRETTATPSSWASGLQDRGVASAGLSRAAHTNLS